MKIEAGFVQVPGHKLQRWANIVHSGERHLNIKGFPNGYFPEKKISTDVAVGSSSDDDIMFDRYRHRIGFYGVRTCFGILRFYSLALYLSARQTNSPPYL